MTLRLKLGAALLLLIACPRLMRAQSFGGQSSFDVRAVPPYRFCVGADNGTDACLSQSGSQAAKLAGSLTVTGSFSAPSHASSSANPAQSGALRLASIDTLCWRNAANSADLCFSKDGSDIFTAPGAFIFPSSLTASNGLTVSNAPITANGGINALLSITSPVFLSSNGNSALTGLLRMNSTDQVCWRNNANNANLCFSKNASDIFTLPGALSTLTLGSGGVAVTQYQHKRISTGSIGATTRTEVLLTWTNTFTDTNYTVTCNVEDSTTAAGTQGLTFERLRTKSATQAGAVINNPTAGGITGTLDCTGSHD